jgi:hypothetical protein
MFNYLRNLTPQTIHLFTSLGGDTPTGIPSTGVARVTEVVVLAPEGPIRCDVFGDGIVLQDVPLVAKGYGAVEGLPEPQPYTAYIVSAIVQAACPDRRDLVAPYDIVRGPDGQIRGCRGFSRPARSGPAALGFFDPDADARLRIEELARIIAESSPPGPAPENA